MTTRAWICFFTICIYVWIGGVTSSPCVPHRGKTALFIGQDFHSIWNYTLAFSDSAAPIGVMSYTALGSSKSGYLRGLVSSVNYGSGVEWTSGLLETYPKSAIQLGLWMVDTYRNVSDGTYDQIVMQLADYVKSSSASFYIRIGYEFDNPENEYLPTDYTKAFKYIVDIFRDKNVQNVAFVWHSYAQHPWKSIEYIDWFPGMNYVDWCGISLFDQPYQCEQSPMNCQFEHADRFAEFCTSKNLPMMIAESTPFGGIVDDEIAAKDPSATNEAGYKQSTWSRWFTPVLSFIERHDVRVWSYINCMWDNQPMWAKRHAPGVHWGDTRIEGTF